jgi:hypothetical protein
LDARAVAGMRAGPCSSSAQWGAAKGMPFQNDDQRKKWLTYGVLVTAIIVASIFIYRHWTRNSSNAPVAMMCMTPGCSYMRSESLSVGDTVPMECPKCNKKSVVPAFKCRRCGTLNIYNEYRGLKPPTKCTKCGKEAYHGS